MTKQVANAKQYPQMFYARHMEVGLAGYENEVILLDADSIKAMIKSFIGKPVYVHHVDEVDMANLKETAHGYVIESFYNELDGWLWVKMLLTDDVALQAVANNWSVSNAYLPTEWGEGGLHHNVAYTRKITNGEFTHMAIVPNPRYENADIFAPDEFKIYQDTKRAQLAELHNSNDNKKEGKDMTKENPIMKFFKNTKTEVTTIDAETVVEIKNDDGTTREVKVSDMIAAVVQNKKNDDKAEEKEEKMNMDGMVRVGDADMPLRDLVTEFCNMKNAKKNEDDDADKKDDKKGDEKENKGKKNESEEDDDGEKQNEADHFKEVKNAPENGTKQLVNTIDLGLDGVARGKTRYGSGK